MVARGLITWLACLVALCAHGAETAPKVDFDAQIRPILSDKCFHCHGPDSASRQADLRLDVATGMGDHIIVAGHPEDSELVRRITSDDPDERMPPDETHLVLTVEEKALLADWIREGAAYTEHWSFRPLPAQVSVPVSKSPWPRGSIDQFVLARLEAAGLKPSPPADPLRLLRRATLDVTGLPPTEAEIRQFQAAAARDPEQAYTQAVDRLLASPAYGENLAVGWLDAARYADSYGYQSDKLNTQWPYRDWVVRAFNENLPYDKFLTWQLAGDLLANPTPDQILATAFNRLHRMTGEGGSIAEECLADIAADRVQTFGTAMLGLTIECARCHDHRYDPITARDYYSLAAFFNSIDESGTYESPAKVPSPTLLLPTPAQSEALDDAQQAVLQAEQALTQARDAAAARFAAWLQQPGDVNVPIDQVFHETFDGPLEEMSSDEIDPKDEAAATHVERVAGVHGSAVRFDGDWGIFFRNKQRLDRWTPFSFALNLRDAARSPKAVVVLQRTRGIDVGYNGFDLMLTAGHLEARLYRVWPGNAIGVRAVEPIAQNEWQHVTVTYDGSSRAQGLRLFLGGRELPTEIVRDKLHKRVSDSGRGHAEIAVGVRFRDWGFQDGQIDELRFFSRTLSPFEIQQLAADRPLAAALHEPTVERDAVREFYLSAIDEPVRAAAANLAAARERFVRAESPLQEVPIMAELPQPRPTYLLARGAYDAPKTDANRVERAAFEQILAPLPPTAPRNRLGLAQWLVAPDHPLTARVFVNRIWARHFGRGLVATPENFGRQGAQPTHPELLNWLARDFVSHGWDIKHLCRQILLSATYRQDSRLRPELRERDPENLLLARGPSQRLSAEQIRDLALAASGLMEATVGGPPVSPYQPGEDLWRESNFMSPPYKQSTGKALYRRSLYSVWKRTAPLPNMSAFDAPTREVCTVARSRTNTPLQALVLLNDVQFVEAARALAATVASSNAEITAQIEAAFIRLTGRTPDTEESRLLRAVYDEQRARFAAAGEQEAIRYTQLGESKSISALPPADFAALTATCQVILNLDATIYER